MNEKSHQEMIEDIKAHVAQTMREVVNGKIENQEKKMDKFIQSFYEASRNQVEATRDINKKLDMYEPYLKGLANISGSAKLIVWLAIGTSSILGAWIAIKSILK